MERITPSVNTNILSYQLDAESFTVRVGSQQWWEWLTGEHTTTFRYVDTVGSFTARREQKRGGWYWYAYRKREGRLHKAYLGKPLELTPERLANVSATLATVKKESNAIHQSPRESAEGQRDSSLLLSKLFVPLPTSKLVGPSASPGPVDRGSASSSHTPAGPCRMGEDDVTLSLAC